MQVTYVWTDHDWFGNIPGATHFLPERSKHATCGLILLLSPSSGNLASGMACDLAGQATAIVQTQHGLPFCSDLPCCCPPDLALHSSTSAAEQWAIRYILFARAVWLGYSVFLIDSDSYMFRDPYTFLKQPPFANIRWAAAEPCSGCRQSPACRLCRAQPLPHGRRGLRCAGPFNLAPWVPAQ